MSRSSRSRPLSCGMRTILVAAVSLADASTIWASVYPAAGDGASSFHRTAMRPSRFGTVARRRRGSIPFHASSAGVSFTTSQGGIYPVPRDHIRVLVHEEPGRGEPGLPGRREVAGPAMHSLSEHAEVEV